MGGITKVIDELGLLILEKEIKIESQKKEIDELKSKIEAIEQYISLYDEYYDQEFDTTA